MKNNGNVLGALLAGILVGSAVGLLMAPKKGSETRDDISESLKKLTKNFKERANAEMEALKEIRDEITGKANAVKNEMVNKKNQYKSDLTDAGDDFLKNENATI